MPEVEGGYGTIVADPPWSFSDKGSRVAPDWKDSTIYSTMAPGEIFALPVDLLAAEKSHLYLWTTDSHLPLAMNCMAEWGFTYKKVLVWVKRRADTTRITGEEEVLRGPLQIGMGHWYRSAKELCLFGVRMGCPGLAKNIVDVLEYPRGQHSRKPDTLLEWAEKMSPGPRIELFARRSREGWEAWGDQFPGHDAFVRTLAKSTERRKQRRAVMTRKLENRVAKVLREMPNMVEGLSRWPGRCCLCQSTIAAGDLVRYLPDDSLKICGGCAMEADLDLSAAT